MYRTPKRQVECTTKHVYLDGKIFLQRSVHNFKWKNNFFGKNLHLSLKKNRREK